MADHPCTVVPEEDLRQIRDLLYRQRATDLETLQRLTKGIGAALMDALVRSAVAIEGTLQEMQEHLKFVVETLTDQVVQIQALRQQGGMGRPEAGLPQAGHADLDAIRGQIAHLEARLGSSERSLDAMRRSMEALGETVARILRSGGPPEAALLDRVADHLHFLSRLEAERAARERLAHAGALSHLADVLAASVLPQIASRRQEVGGNVTAYDALRGLEAMAREACADLRREARRLTEAAASSVAAAPEAPGNLTEKLDACGELLALGAAPEMADEVAFAAREAVRQWFLPLVDLAVQCREAVAGPAQAVFGQVVADLHAAGRAAGLQVVLPVPGEELDEAVHDPGCPAPEGPAQVESVLAPGYRMGGAVVRRARVTAVARST